jgi:hypothetical protein
VTFTAEALFDSVHFFVRGIGTIHGFCACSQQRSLRMPDQRRRVSGSGDDRSLRREPAEGWGNDVGLITSP